MNLKVEEASSLPPNVAGASQLPAKVTEASRLPKSFKIGEGWDYNPGKAFLSFDTDFGNFKIYPHQKTYKDYGLPPANLLPDDDFIKSPELVNPASKNLYDIIKDEFGLDDKTSMNKIHTKDKTEVFISLQDFKYLIDKKDQRIKFLKLIKPTLENPFESYLTLYQSDKGFVEYRKNYIGLYIDKSKRKFIVVIKEKKDSFIIWNAFPAQNIDSYRKGELLYKRK